MIIRNLIRKLLTFEAPMQRSTRRQLLGPAFLRPKPDFVRFDKRRRTRRRMGALPLGPLAGFQHPLQRSRTPTEQFAQILPLATQCPHGSSPTGPVHRVAAGYAPRILLSQSLK